MKNWQNIVFKLINNNYIESYFFNKINKNYNYIYKIPKKLLQNFHFSTKLIKYVYFPDIYKQLYIYFPKKFFNNINFVIEAVKYDCNLILCVPNNLKYNNNIYLSCKEYYHYQYYNGYYIYNETHQYFKFYSILIDFDTDTEYYYSSSDDTVIYMEN